MVSLRRRRLLGLCSGKNSFQAPISKTSSNGTIPENVYQNSRVISEHPTAMSDVKEPQETTIIEGQGTPDVSGSSLSKEHDCSPIPGESIKQRKRYRRKPNNNHKPCLLRGVYFKNMKWQAAIKVDKKQIHLGTVSSQEEAAHLYDRAAFMCGRKPNSELSKEEKQELRKFKWEEFLEMTRRAITTKKQKRYAGQQEKYDHLSRSNDQNGV